MQVDFSLVFWYNIKSPLTLRPLLHQPWRGTVDHPPSRPSCTQLMEDGADLLQAGKAERAFDVFKFVADVVISDEDRARAFQMTGITARLQGKLDISETYFVLALALATHVGNEVLRGAILRDQGATREALFATTSDPTYLKGAQECYAQSVRILETLVSMERTELSYQLQSELLSTQGFYEMFIWRTVKNRTLRREARERLHDCYMELKWLNADIAHQALQGHMTAAPFEVYQANLLMRVVRVNSVFGRIRYCAELLRLTSPSSASPGRRKQAIVALVGGDHLYRWLELRHMAR